MRQIKVQKLTKEAFECFGSYTNFLSPEGMNFGGFYRDQVTMSVSGRMQMAFSPLTVQKPEKMVVDKAEYHDYTAEIVMPLDDDAVLHVAPASNRPVPELTEAFLVPKGTMACLNPGVWHMAALPVNLSEFHVLIGLPERTYQTDCNVVPYEEKDQVEMVF